MHMLSFQSFKHVCMCVCVYAWMCVQEFEEQEKRRSQDLEQDRTYQKPRAGARSSDGIRHCPGAISHTAQQQPSNTDVFAFIFSPPIF